MNVNGISCYSTLLKTKILGAKTLHLYPDLIMVWLVAIGIDMVTVEGLSLPMFSAWRWHPRKFSFISYIKRKNSNMLTFKQIQMTITDPKELETK